MKDWLVLRKLLRQGNVGFKHTSYRADSIVYSINYIYYSGPTSVAFLIFMFKVNIPVVRNHISKKQIMNGTFDKLRLCSTYGAFGMVAERVRN